MQHRSTAPNRVRKWRKKRHLTLAQLAPRVGVTLGHLGNLERGTRELTKPVLDRLARELQCAQADLLNEADGGLTEEERRIIAIYRASTEAARCAIAAVAESQQPYSASQKSPTDTRVRRNCDGKPVATDPPERA